MKVHELKPAPGSTTRKRRVGQRRTLVDLGIAADQEPVIVVDAVEDVAIDNSPRIPTAPEVAAMLAAVRA